MEFTLTISGTAAELSDLLSKMQGGANGSTVKKAAVNGAAKTKKPVLVEDEDPIEEEMPDEDDFSDDAAEAEAEDSGITIEQIRKVVQQKMEDHTDEIAALLKKYKAKNLTALDKKHYPEFFAAVKKIK